MNVPKSRVSPARSGALRFRADGAAPSSFPPAAAAAAASKFGRNAAATSEANIQPKQERSSSPPLSVSALRREQEVRTLKVLQMTPPAQPGPTEHGTGRLGSAPVRPAGSGEQRWAGSRQAGLKPKDTPSDTTRTRTNPELSLFMWLHIAHSNILIRFKK